MDNEYRERRPEEVPEDGTETGGAMAGSVRPVRPVTKGGEGQARPCGTGGRLTFRKACWIYSLFFDHKQRSR